MTDGVVETGADGEGLSDDGGQDKGKSERLHLGEE